MSEIKFEEGQKVRFRSKTAAGIDMKVTKVVGFQDKHENVWKRKYSDIAQGYKPCRVPAGQGRVENRYVIEHYYGWYPSLQEGLNPELDLNINRRYNFAYESELSAVRDDNKEEVGSK